jgi:hypothetical protein
MTTRARLTALSLLLGATAIIGAATSGQAIASPVDPAPSPKTTSAAAKRSCPAGSVCRAARQCPRGRICLWSAEHFFGTKKVVRPVPSGKCRELGRFVEGWRSVYNASDKFARLWQLAVQGVLSPGPKCIGANYGVAPHTARRDISFDFNHNGRDSGLDGLGGR